MVVGLIIFVVGGPSAGPRRSIQASEASVPPPSTAPPPPSAASTAPLVTPASTAAGTVFAKMGRSVKKHSLDSKDEDFFSSGVDSRNNLLLAAAAAAASR